MTKSNILTHSLKSNWVWERKWNLFLGFCDGWWPCWGCSSSKRRQREEPRQRGKRAPWSTPVQSSPSFCIRHLPPFRFFWEAKTLTLERVTAWKRSNASRRRSENGWSFQSWKKTHSDSVTLQLFFSGAYNAASYWHFFLRFGAPICCNLLFHPTYFTIFSFSPLHFLLK